MSPLYCAAGDSASGLAAVKALQIPHGAITSATFSADPAMTVGDKTLDGLPPRTVVQILLQPASGSNIRVEIWLPEEKKWNGKLLGLGNGGAAGNINAGNLSWPLKRGYVSATTDMGTAPAADVGNGNREVWKDFGYRATHLMTLAAKQVIQAYYSRAPERSYFLGGSTGGQQALQEAQRYPEDYDGILANVPAHCRTPLHAYFLWNEQILRACPFSEEQQKAVTAAGIEYMAGREIPPTAGKLVSDPRCTAADIEAVIALARKKEPSLTDRHAEALRKLLTGPVHAVTGEKIFGGVPLGSSFNSAHGNLYLFHWVFGAQQDLMKLDFGKDFDTYTAALAPYLNAENPDLSAFAKRGGKLIMVSGSADECVPYHATLDYYERVIAKCGSLADTQRFCRFYIIPGMAHSLGAGPGINKLPDWLTLLDGWREKGSAPGAVAAQRVVDGQTVIDIRLYPYPQKTAYADGACQPVEGPRGGVERVAEPCLPPAAE